MSWLVDNSLCKSVGQGFGSHHSAGERINASGSGLRLMNGLGVQNERPQFIQQLQTWQLAPAHPPTPIIIVAAFSGQSANEDGGIKTFFATQRVKLRQLSL